MSLNSLEQRLFDYLRSHPDEHRFWKERVRRTAARAGSDAEAATEIERDLWSYYRERAGVYPDWRQGAPLEALRRTSMRNLAELVLRLELPPRPKSEKN